MHLRYSAFDLLTGVNFAVEPQERFVIMGQSGAGKTTILRLILGLIRPSSGSVLFANRDIASFADEELRRVRSSIGMVFEEAALLSSLTVRENLALPLRELTDMSDAEIRRIADEKLELVGLHGEGETMPFELSGGMRKRAGLARALVTNPSVILFDEPTAGLDPVTSAVIEKLIIDLTERTKVTSIIATPVTRTALRLATRIAMLHGGNIVADAAPDVFRCSEHPIVKRFMSVSAPPPLVPQPMVRAA